jgi:hypothetical protein
MLEQLNMELMEIREKLSSRRKLLADTERTTKMLFERNAKLQELESFLKKEDADVKKLEGLSLTALFYSIVGDKELKLNKERQELLAAKLKYDECKYSVTALEKEIEGFKIRIAALGDLDAQYEAFIRKKEELITQSSNENSRKLLEISESITDTQSKLKELNEAVAAGKNALKGLHEIVGYLESAKNWGTFDMLGGGFISTAVKHSKIDKAKDSINKVQQQIRVFQMELADTGTITEIKIEIDSFSKFADYVFDGLIFDWVVQSKIKRSLESVTQVSERISRVVKHLQNNYKDVQEKQKTLEEEKRIIIEQIP